MKVSKILAFRNDRFGEFILNIPAFWGLKQNYPGAELTLVVDSYVKQLAQAIPFVDKVLTWENRKHTLKELLAFSRELKKQKYDLCVIFNPSKEFNIVSFLASILLRLGYDRKFGFLLNRKIKDKKSEGLKHEADYNLDLLKAFNPNLEFKNPEVFLKINSEDIPKEISSDLLSRESNCIALHPWSSNKAKEWPELKFKELAAKLTQEYNFKIVLIGGQEELARSQGFAQEKAMINLTGKTNLIELAAILKRCKLLVTNDSGPMHLAAVLGTPVVAIFRKSPQAVSPRRWGPLGCNHVILENENINDIKIDEVLNGVQKIIQR